MLPVSNFCAPRRSRRLSGLADAVITSAAGYPLDLTFYQTIKGLTAAQHIVKPGGKDPYAGRMLRGRGLA